MNNLNLSEDKINMLLAAAGKKLGQSPEQLKQQLQSGSLEQLTRNMDPKAINQVNALLQNPQALEAMLGNEKVKGMLHNLLGNR